MQRQQCTQAMHASMRLKQCRTDGRTDGLTEMAGKRGAVTCGLSTHTRVLGFGGFGGRFGR